ncbi:protein S-acyltransferase 12 isoform X1 [Populus alba x Populus x berolinensis]|uniref:S-acyltransferase n=1 Tax=Populus alba x Populus x berolinensis TaxID=444605 RepID=A0AAD6LT00_9ROSI|nr:protein S-acyltransferase 12 isoform X1 [Populus alba x Populus x berolinensis]
MEINVFKLCSGLKVLGYLMILLVAAIIAVSYHAVVIVTCGPQLLRGGAHSVLAFAIIIIFHFLLIMLLWSYFRVVFKDPGSVPENWRAVLPEEALETGSSLNDSSDCVVAADGLDRRAFCNHCQNGKPPRCHHCSVCRPSFLTFKCLVFSMFSVSQRCVLKMDHHCVWVVNCVGARNYKFFLLFLVISIPPFKSTYKLLVTTETIFFSKRLSTSFFSLKLYTFMVTTMDTLVLLPGFINFFGKAKNHSSSPSDLAVIFLAFVLNLAFALSLLCFVVMHASLLSSNTTSIEVYEKKGAARWKYDLGRKKNFEQVFGTKKALWFFPLFSKEDVDKIPALHGLDFPIRADLES